MLDRSDQQAVDDGLKCLQEFRFVSYGTLGFVRIIARLIRVITKVSK